MWLARCRVKDATFGGDGSCGWLWKVLMPCPKFESDHHITVSKKLVFAYDSSIGTDMFHVFFAGFFDPNLPSLKANVKFCNSKITKTGFLIILWVRHCHLEAQFLLK